MAGVYRQAGYLAATAGLDWVGCTARLALLPDGYAFDAVNHQYLSDVADIVTPLKSVALTGKAVLANGTLDAADIADLAVPGTTEVYAAVLYIDTGDASTSTLLLHYDASDDADFGYDPSVADPEKWEWNASGILRFVA